MEQEMDARAERMCRMGASNVTKVFTYWAHLNHRDKVVLLFMANTALDADDPPRYWKSWQPLALALGFDIGDGTNERIVANASEQIRRVLASLAKAGAVVSSARARTNIKAEYALALDPAYTFKPSGVGRQVTWEKVERDSTGKVESSHRKGGEGRSDSTEKDGSSHQEGGEVPPNRWKVPTKKVPPMSSEEPIKEKKEEESGIRPSPADQCPPALGLKPTPPEVEASELKADGVNPEAVDYVLRLRLKPGTRNEYAHVRSRLQRCRGLTGPEIWELALSKKWVHQSTTTPPWATALLSEGRTLPARAGSILERASSA